VREPVAGKPDGFNASSRFRGTNRKAAVLYLFEIAGGLHQDIIAHGLSHGQLRCKLPWRARVIVIDPGLRQQQPRGVIAAHRAEKLASSRVRRRDSGMNQ